MWLEITGQCQLQCTHCYAESGPDGTHGTMTTPDWRRVLEEAARIGVQLVQFIGGEPTLHPALPELVGHGLARGLEIEIFTNLVHVSPELWKTFTRPGVRLATSWYAA
ncbi:radical SAM protein [Actinoallomurus purpureus]|nr:radical SAM protein [Actinoallomurus purpureus]